MKDIFQNNQSQSRQILVRNHLFIFCLVNLISGEPLCYKESKVNQVPFFFFFIQKKKKVVHELI